MRTENIGPRRNALAASVDQTDARKSSITLGRLRAGST
jgi:hypothetical protein